jgi:hypothetical protein
MQLQHDRRASLSHVKMNCTAMIRSLIYYDRFMDL